jgi:uncharacterized protein (UPF0276 family)
VCAVTQLTTQLSDALIGLIQADHAPIDAIEVGPWYSAEQVCQVQAQLAGWQFHFHAGNLITRIGPMPRITRQLEAYLRCTQSPWISCHLTLLRPGYIWLALRLGWYLPPPNTAKAAKRFVRRVSGLARTIKVPIILENMPVPPDGKGRYAFDSDPDLINEILAKTGCKMLLDLAHTRVAAANKGIDVYDYLDRLPLEEVVQIHVSGPRMHDGYLRDVHEPLQEIDYALLEWVLARVKPQVLTLEYFKERKLLHEQLSRLRNMLGP